MDTDVAGDGGRAVRARSGARARRRSPSCSSATCRARAATGKAAANRSARRSSAAALTLEADTIVVPAGDFQLSQGQVLIDTDVTIAGAGARNTTIRGNANAFRAFEVAAGVTASITGVTLNGGRGTAAEHAASSPAG